MVVLLVVIHLEDDNEDVAFEMVVRPRTKDEFRRRSPQNHPCALQFGAKGKKSVVRLN